MLDCARGEGRFQVGDDLDGSFGAEGIVGEAGAFGGYVFGEAVNFLLELGNFGGFVDGVGVRDAKIELGGGAEGAGGVV